MPHPWPTWTDAWEGLVSLYEAGPPLGSPAWVAMAFIVLLCLMVVVAAATLQPPMAPKLRARPCPPPPPMPSTPSAPCASEAGPTSHHVNHQTQWPNEDTREMLWAMEIFLRDRVWEASLLEDHPQNPETDESCRYWTRLLGQQDMFQHPVIHN